MLKPPGTSPRNPVTELQTASDPSETADPPPAQRPNSRSSPTPGGPSYGRCGKTTCSTDQQNTGHKAGLCIYICIHDIMYIYNNGT